MIMHELFKGAYPQVGIGATAAGTTAITGNTIDTAGYDGCAFIFCYGALTASQVTNAKLQGGLVSTGSDAADLAGSHTTALLDSQSNTYQIIDCYRPTFRYLTPIVNRGTANAVLNQCVAILYHGQLTPPTLVTNSPLASAVVTLAAPVLGTA